MHVECYGLRWELSSTTHISDSSPIRRVETNVLLRVRDGRANCLLGGNTCFRKGVVTRIEIFAILRGDEYIVWPDRWRKTSLLDFGEYVLMSGQFPVQREELPLLLRQRL